MENQMPFFSVILATRDRPSLFGDALASVLAQSCKDFEVIINDDGSSETNTKLYTPIFQKTAERLGNRLQVRRLLRRPRGHGQSYVLNYGVAQSHSRYVCFLDDDDCWIDPNHLQRAMQSIGSNSAVDIYMCNQAAYRGEDRMHGPVWIEALASVVSKRGGLPNSDGSLVVGVSDLMFLTGFCHVNALIVRKEFYEAVGGLDENIRWECDRDLFLRLIDQAKLILHHPAVIARHNIPNPVEGASMTTSLGKLDRWLYQLRVLDKASLFICHPSIRAYARQHKAFTLKRIAEERYGARDWHAAAFYAREALAAGPT